MPVDVRAEVARDDLSRDRTLVFFTSNTINPDVPLRTCAPTSTQLSLSETALVQSFAHYSQRITPRYAWLMPVATEENELLPISLLGTQYAEELRQVCHSVSNQHDGPYRLSIVRLAGTKILRDW
jgi:hypothetical protein